MKHFASICFILVLALLVLVSSDASAAIKIRPVGRALNDYPGSKWQIANALHVVGVGAKVFLMVDTTGSGETGAASWSFGGALPGGSATTFDSTSTYKTSFTADVIGFYYVAVTVGASTARDTIYASTYVGPTDEVDAGCTCHSLTPGQGNILNIVSGWRSSGHSSIFARGITGQLEVVPEINRGMYAKSCVQCHTEGYDPNLNNGNFGYLAHTLPAPSPNSWDSTWFAGLPWSADGRDVMITYKDSTIYKALPAAMAKVGTIGCENCHGPAAGHKMGAGVGNFKQSIDKTMDAAVCNQCHNASGKHNVGKYYNTSAHAQIPGHTASIGCAPCHQGATFVKWIKADKDTTGFARSVTSAELTTAISCQTCHDPHSAELRQVSVDSLRNGFKYKPAGKSQVCSYCHSSRYSVKVRVTTKAPYYGFTNRFGPHENPQYDMLAGGNGYEYGDPMISGINTHMGLEDGCVTCHMQTRGSHTNHAWSMEDTTGGFKPVTVCKPCHGDIEDFNDVKALYDYDRNGKIEGVQTEIQGLLDKVKAMLPIDASTGEPSTASKDTLLYKNRPDLVQALWNYYFVKNDHSMGVHNAKYAVALLQKVLGYFPLDVKPTGNEIPKEFALNQNYPNPFNPSTTISFALPKNAKVKLEIYDILGNLVKTMVNQDMGAGNYQVVWDGMDRNGARVASGVYLYRIQAGDFQTVKKMLMVK